MKLDVLNKEGNSTGKKVDLPKKIFGEGPRDHAVYLDAKRILAGRRKGLSKVKERSEIVGSAQKMRRQKGTGMARVGNIKNPLFRGGGRIFGPHPKRYTSKLNKKTQKLARKSALSQKAKDNQILVVEDLKFDQPKTREFYQIIKNLKIDGKRLLFVNGNNKDTNLLLSMRNISGVDYCSASSLNTYDILNCKYLVIEESAVKEVVKNNQ